MPSPPSPPPPLCFTQAPRPCLRQDSKPEAHSISSLHVNTSLSELPLGFPTGFLMGQTCYLLKFLFSFFSFFKKLSHAVKYSFPVFFTILCQASIRQNSDVDAVFPFCQPLLFFLYASLSTPPYTLGFLAPINRQSLAGSSKIEIHLKEYCILHRILGPEKFQTLQPEAIP